MEDGKIYTYQSPTAPLPPGSRGLLPTLDLILDWCVVRHSTVITASDEVGI